MLTTRKLFIIWLFGAISGFTLMIGSNTLNYWLAAEHIDIRTIGIFACMSIPYAINFLWAPIFDTKKPGFLAGRIGNRLSWVCSIQFLLSGSIFILSLLSPTSNLLLFAIATFCISLLASAQDTVLGAIRTEMIDKKSQGSAAGVYIFGYRIGMLFANSLAIYISSYIGWNRIYAIFSIITLAVAVILILNHKTINGGHHTLLQNQITTSERFISAVLKPIGSWSMILLIISFLILYRLPDNFINMMINPFLIHMDFDAQELAGGKFFGTVTAIIGGLIASLVMRKRDVLSSLLIFGVWHAIAHSFFIFQELYGKNVPLMLLILGFESITGGMTMAAYIAFIGSLCEGRFRATQYSFFSAMMGLSRSTFPALSGYLVVKFGWYNFFLFTTLATIPSLLLLFKLAKSLKHRWRETDG